MNCIATLINSILFPLAKFHFIATKFLDQDFNNHFLYLFSIFYYIRQTIINHF